MIIMIDREYGKRYKGTKQNTNWSPTRIVFALSTGRYNNQTTGLTQQQLVLKV